MNLGVFLPSGITEFVNRYSPIVLNDTEVILLFTLIILFILLVWVLFMLFKTRENPPKKSDLKKVKKKAKSEYPRKQSAIKTGRTDGEGANKQKVKADRYSKSSKQSGDSITSKKEENPPLKGLSKRPGVKKEINLPPEKYSERSKKKETGKNRVDSNDPSPVVKEEKTVYETSDKNETVDVEIRSKPPKKSGSSVTEVRENKNESKKLIYIGYEPSDKFKQRSDWAYPVVKMPDSGCVIRRPYHRKQQIRGYKENSFQQTLNNAFEKVFDVLGDCVVSTGSETRPFEPDIALRRLKDNQNIFIDVEIDEPYGGVSRSVTHAKGEDDHRDLYFISRGWIVIRFAEIQVHKQARQCVAFICKVVKEIAPEIGIPPSLLNMENPKIVEQWDQIQAEQWAKENYREKYLGHEFSTIEDIKENDSAIEFSEIDKKVEELVKPIKYVNENPESVKGKINLANFVNRDKRIQFFPEEHLYLIDGVPAKSVSEVVARFFPAFDKMGISRTLALKRGTTQEAILAEWDRATDAGTFLHSQIENYYNDEAYESPPAFAYFLNFINEHSHLDTFRTEWRVFDEKKMIAGTIDYVSDNGDGTFNIYDWKRSKNVVDEYYWDGPQKTHPFGTGFGPLRHIDSTAYNKYCLQQGIYKRLLEKHYNIPVRDMYIVVLHPRYSDFHKFRVEEYEKEVDYILQNI